MKDIYAKQCKLFDPTKNKRRIHVIGLGSVGSFAAWSLAKAGYKDIFLYDFDTIEETNIPAQLFGYEFVDKKKTDALYDIIKRDTQVECEVIEGEVTKDSELPVVSEDILLLLVDSKEARKVIFERLKAIPNLWIVETGIGMFNLKMFCFNTDNERMIKRYEKSLTHPPSQLSCGEKCCIPVNMAISAEILMNCFRISKGIEVQRYFYRNMEEAMIISDREKLEFLYNSDEKTEKVTTDTKEEIES